MNVRLATSFALVLGVASPLAFGQLPPPADPEAVLSDAYQGKSYSPYAGRGFPSRPLWGDSHLHTGLSFDAAAFGNRLGVRDAYRFAPGEEVVSSTGLALKLSRPLDWLVVADHSDPMGFSRISWSANPISSQTRRDETGTTGSWQATACRSQ